MEYRVQGLVSPNTVGEFHLRDCNVAEWIEADSPFEAAIKFIVNHPEVNTSPILTVDREYNMGNYPIENVIANIDIQWSKI